MGCLLRTEIPLSNCAEHCTSEGFASITVTAKRVNTGFEDGMYSVGPWFTFRRILSHVPGASFNINDDLQVDICPPVLKHYSIVGIHSWIVALCS